MINVLKKMLRSFSGKALDGELSWRTSGPEKEPYPKPYLDMVKAEQKRRETKRIKKGSHNNEAATL